MHQAAKNVRCSILTNNANNATMEISKDLAEAKKQLQEHINKVKSKRQQRNVNIFDQGSNYHIILQIAKIPSSIINCIEYRSIYFFYLFFSLFL